VSTKNQLVGLLRGINVGGKNRVEMPRLKGVFERLGMGSVRTYINTGNVLFTAESGDHLTSHLATAIADEFGFEIPLLVVSAPRFVTVAEAIPPDWRNDSSMKCDVMFLWEQVDDAGIVDRLGPKDGIDHVLYVPGAVIWRVDRRNINQTTMLRIVGTDLYKAITIRNCNTVRKLADLIIAG
jgi:uncharacterized protein (DUF1697 family)